jgi:hypothetical protein
MDFDSVKIVLNTLCDKVWKWLEAGRLFSPVASTNKTDRHDMPEILLKAWRQYEVNSWYKINILSIMF